MYTLKKVSMKIVAMLAAVTMVFTMMPMSVNANSATNTVIVGGNSATAGYENSDVETLRKAFANYNTANSQIILGADIDIPASSADGIPIVPVIITKDGEYNFDLNGHKATFASYLSFFKIIPNVNANLSICDNSSSKTGEISASKGNSIIENLGNGNISIKDGKYKNSKDTGLIISNSSNGTIVVEGKAILESGIAGSAMSLNGTGLVTLKGQAEVISNSNFGTIVFNTARTTKSIEILEDAKVTNTSGSYGLRFSNGVTEDAVSSLYTLNSTAMNTIKTYPTLAKVRTQVLDVGLLNGTDTYQGMTPVNGVYTNDEEKWAYDTNTKTLELTNAKFQVSYGAAIQTSASATTIIVKGENNTITNSGAGYGIFSSGNLLIKGDGNLSINMSHKDVNGEYEAGGIIANGELTIGEDEDGVSLDIMSTLKYGIKSNSVLTVNTRNLGVTAPYGKAVVGERGILLTDMVAYYNTGEFYDGLTHIEAGVICEGVTGSISATDIIMGNDYSYKGGEAATPSSSPISKTDTQIVLAPVTVVGEVVEYAISTSPTAPTTGWQLGTTFNGLKANTKYYFFARVSENDYHFAGVPSAGVMIQTAKAGAGGVNTGDTTNTTQYITLTMLSGCVAVFLILKRKKLLVK